ncbi:Lead, cadmium, zinc and mercury-transporting ATPase [Roseomonas sp. TAS13]|jgi:copper chaperone|uniref:Heavy-metal-associated domain-containing protein n=3 Tax=Roseomonadaceae TaxID=3385906 RepID=A0A9X1YD79_9PROT|nr:MULTISPECIES: heavy metal-associated domain-containing protein [Roseomonas]MBS5904676.1 heavy-metal-associated domain-containing protein [Acetobacteraceae bacterium]ATR19247.1 copper-transporting ATPase [Roseomonas sp. FDAARGOS_362]MBB5695910.1 Cd2+/Zn2+-exporting ATPase [Roseomonas pecuniae]MCG7351897.1 heavy-metal-associated domain-containing protein [Roseomonas mucosa]MCG7356103.1 heavy-metal-associated domain-containing protein [Roseomonas mucosa]
MANSETTAPGTRVDLRYRVDGMDCSSCALKIEDAVEHLGGTEDIQVNYKTETLEFRLDEATTPRSAVEDMIRKLGYGVAPLA